MPFLFLLLAVNAFALTKDDFFPRFTGGQVIEDRIIGKEKLERGLEKRNTTYRYVIFWEGLSKMKMEVAHPIHKLSQYSTCSMYGLQPLQVSIHLEPFWVDTFFQCVMLPDYDPVKFKKELQDKYCAESAIRSEAQDIICKELMLK